MADNLHAQIARATAQHNQSQAVQRQLLTFMLGDELYGLDILHVQEILSWQQPTRIPNAPPYMSGALNLRGEIVPVMDMRVRFNMPQAAFTPQTVVIVVRVARRVVGLVVDSVAQVEDVQQSSLRATPDFGTAIDGAYLEGLVTAQNGEMVIVLNTLYLLQKTGILLEEEPQPT